MPRGLPHVQGKQLQPVGDHHCNKASLGVLSDTQGPTSLVTPVETPPASLPFSPPPGVTCKVCTVQGVLRGRGVEGPRPPASIDRFRQAPAMWPPIRCSRFTFPSTDRIHMLLSKRAITGMAKATSLARTGFPELRPWTGGGETVSPKACAVWAKGSGRNACFGCWLHTVYMGTGHLQCSSIASGLGQFRERVYGASSFDLSPPLRATISL